MTEKQLLKYEGKWCKVKFWQAKKGKLDYEGMISFEKTKNFVYRMNHRYEKWHWDMQIASYNKGEWVNWRDYKYLASIEEVEMPEEQEQYFTDED